STKLTGSSGALRVYAQYLQYRIPQPLQLPWPQGIGTFGFAQQAQGGLTLDCDNAFKLPIWDPQQKLKQQCDNRPTEWIKNLFQW
ncbi:MAG: penicillin-binding protein 1B, partial [Vibrio sp.]